jgi:tetratricopeptide (TPR) repeat protein
VNTADAVQFEKDIEAALAAGELDRAEATAQCYCRAAEGEWRGEPAHSPGFRSNYLAAQVKLAAGRLQKAIELLSPLLAVAGELPVELACRVRLLAAEALARLRRHAEARTLLEQVPAALLDGEPLLRLGALRVRLWLGEVSRLGPLLAACVRALEAGGDTANGALLLCEEGRAWDWAGDLAAAQDCWLRAERLAHPNQAGVSPIRADVLLQRGRLDHLRGHLASALELYDEALRCATPGPQALELQLRRLLVRLDLNEWEPVRAAAAALLPAGSPGQLPEELRPLAGMVLGLLSGAAPADAPVELRAYLAAERGDEAAARSLYAAALAADPSPERRARLALALGLLAWAHSDPVEARSWLGQAEELARSLKLPEILIRTLQVSGQMAAEQQGNDELARKHFEEAILLAEVQAGKFRKVLPAQAYRERRASVLRYLLRSACRRGDAWRVFQYQELERGRLLLDLLRTAGQRRATVSLCEQPDIADLEGGIAACEQDLLTIEGSPASSGRREDLLRRREELQLRRDRLFEDFLRDRGRCSSAILPSLPELTQLVSSLPTGTLYVAPTLSGDELYLLAASRDGPVRVIRGSGSGLAVCRDLEDLRDCLTSQLARYRRGLPMGRPQRAQLDERLDALSRGPLGAALGEALGSGSIRPQRVVWAPDGPLHGFPVHALRMGGRYLIEELEFVWTFSGALFVHQAATGKQRRGRFRPAVVVADRQSVLPEAEREGDGVARSFLWGRRLPAEVVNRKSLRRWLARARVAHFACHAEFDGQRPLAAQLRLPSGEAIHALDWLEEPVAGLPLVTLSACRSAEVAPLVGREVFGIVTGLLGGGVRAVLAGLWPVADRETPPLMWRFYRHRLLHELPTALALAQREALELPDSSPLFWAVFALFGDGAAIPAPGFLCRFLARPRQRRHLQLFPV